MVSLDVHTYDLMLCRYKVCSQTPTRRFKRFCAQRQRETSELDNSCISDDSHAGAITLFTALHVQAVHRVWQLAVNGTGYYFCQMLHSHNQIRLVFWFPFNKIHFTKQPGTPERFCTAATGLYRDRSTTAAPR